MMEAMKMGKRRRKKMLMVSNRRPTAEDPKEGKQEGETQKQATRGRATQVNSQSKGLLQDFTVAFLPP